MRYIFPAKLIGRNRRSCKMILILVWCGGLLLGALGASGASNSINSLMRACVDSRVTIVGLLSVPLLPFLFSAVAVYLSISWLIYPIGFVKAFCFGFCACAVTIAYGSAGWLMMYLLLFTDCLTLPVLCWFWIRHVDGNKGRLWGDGVACMLWFVLIGSFDFWVVLPLLDKIF